MTYRPPRAGDLLAVRVTDPHADEIQIVINRVQDNGRYLLMAGAHGDFDLEVLVRRVGDTNPQPVEK
jgi:hypothetical protein